jgi:hypothetical protein
MLTFRVVLCALILLVFVGAAAAQSTIFNVPSTDTLAEKQVYLEADFVNDFGSYRKGGFQTYGYRVVYGARKRLEIGANFFYTQNGRAVPVELQPNFKWQAFANEKHGVAVSGGAILFAPLTRTAGRRSFGVAYSNVSKVVKGAKGMRLTGGAYKVIGAPGGFGAKTGAILGLEQPVRKRLSFIADWYSGKNRFGYATTGFSYSVTKKQFLFVGYNFSNLGRDTDTISVYYGYTF